MCSVVFEYLRYEWTMFLFAGISVFGAVVCWFLLPSELNVSLTDEEADHVQDHIKSQISQAQATTDT